MSEALGVDPGDGISGFGTTLQGASTGVVGMITRAALAGFDVDNDIDITTMNSPQKWKRFISGLKDAKEVSLDLVYEKANMVVILGALGSANEAWTVVLPDGSTFVCSGYVKHIGTEIPMGDKIGQTLTIRFSGVPTFHAAS